MAILELEKVEQTIKFVSKQSCDFCKKVFRRGYMELCQLGKISVKFNKGTYAGDICEKCFLDRDIKKFLKKLKKVRI